MLSCMVLAAALLLRGEASVLRSIQNKSSLASYTFEQFVSDFGRYYVSGSSEYETRAGHFASSLRRVLRINKKNDKEGRAWLAGIHPFMDWSESERRALNGYKSFRTSGASSVLYLQVDVDGAVDSNVTGVSTSASWEGVAMREQGMCGSCWAISAAEAVEARLPEKNRLAAQALIDCVPNPKHCGGKGGCEGATGELAYTFMKEHGIPLEHDYAYTAETGQCPMTPLIGDFPAPKRAKVSGWTSLPSNKAEPLLQALYSKGPVVVAVDADAWFEYKSGIFDGCKKDAHIGHAVLAKGYGGQGDAQYWHIQNSWGAEWGEHGQIRLKRQESAEEEKYCGVDTKPQDGVGCDGGPAKVTTCGMCGILYDAIYPEGVNIEDAQATAYKEMVEQASLHGSMHRSERWNKLIAKAEGESQPDEEPSLDGPSHEADELTEPGEPIAMAARRLRMSRVHVVD